MVKGKYPWNIPVNRYIRQKKYMVLCLSANPLLWAEIQFLGSKGGLGHLLTFSNEHIGWRHARAYHVVFLTNRYWWVSCLSQDLFCCREKTKPLQRRAHNLSNVCPTANRYIYYTLARWLWIRALSSYQRPNPQAHDRFTSFDSCEPTVYESTSEECWKSTRRLVISSAADSLKLGRVSHCTLYFLHWIHNFIC